MKKRTFRLLATMITLAAVTTITTFSASAQRRTTGRQSTNSGVKKSDESRKRIVQQKSTFKDYNKVERTPRNNSVTKNRSIERKSAPTATQNQNRNRSTQTAYRNSDSNKSRSVKSNTVPKSRNDINDRSNFRNSKSTNSNLDRNREKVYANRGKTTANSSKVSSDRRRTTTGVKTRNESVLTSKNRTKYQLDKNDRRYKPNNNYKGNNKTWAGSHRPNKMNYNHNSNKFYHNYNHNSYKHWDRGWERYCWNHTSWRDYYHGYNPNSYRYHKNYYRHNYYGHVIRRFVYAPQIFIHNHNQYYSYNGHFFRYHRGVGYILVDIPFGLTFDYLPYNYERVYINGYLYFRVGNLFFERSNYGFQLVHYPERYYAYGNDYRNEGYYFEENF